MSQGKHLLTTSGHYLTVSGHRVYLGHPVSTGQGSSGGGGSFASGGVTNVYKLGALVVKCTAATNAKTSTKIEIISKNIKNVFGTVSTNVSSVCTCRAKTRKILPKKTQAEQEQVLATTQRVRSNSATHIVQSAKIAGLSVRNRVGSATFATFTSGVNALCVVNNIQNRPGPSTMVVQEQVYADDAEILELVSAMLEAELV